MDTGIEERPTVSTVITSYSIHYTKLYEDGDTILIEGKQAAFRLGGEPKTPEERQEAAKMHYEKAFVLLQTGKNSNEALERLNKALEYNPAFGDAYVLKSYLRLEIIPDLNEALRNNFV